MMKVLASLFLAALVAACTPYQLIPAGKVDLQGKAQVTTPVAWNSLAGRDSISWTQDGPLLQNLYFHLAVEDGETIFRDLDMEAKQDPLLIFVGIKKDLVSLRFRKTMTEPELMDLFAASWGAMVGSPLTTTGLAPATLGGHPGFRFDYAFAGKDDVLRKGFATSAVVDGKLYVVHYFGTAIHHFDKLRPEAEKVVESFTIPKKSG